MCVKFRQCGVRPLCCVLASPPSPMLVQATWIMISTAPHQPRLSIFLTPAHQRYLSLFMLNSVCRFGILYKKCCGSGSAWIRLDPELLTLSRTLFLFSGSTQLGKRRFYKFYFICELETWFTVGLKWQIICRFLVSFNLRCVVHNLVGSDPEPHGCELLPGSGSAWMRTFTWIRIHMDANFYLDPDPHPEFGKFNLHLVPDPEWIICYSQHCM